MKNPPSVSAIFLTAQELADQAECEVDTINEKAARRELPGVKLGRSWIFPVEALAAVLNERALEAMAIKTNKGGSVVPIKASGPRRAKPPSLV